MGPFDWSEAARELRIDRVHEEGGGRRGVAGISSGPSNNSRTPSGS